MDTNEVVALGRLKSVYIHWIDYNFYSQKLSQIFAK